MALGENKKRTPRLYYIKGGFHTLISALEQSITKNNGKILINTSVNSLNLLRTQFDKILLTIPTALAKKLIPNLESSILHLHAQVLILETDKPILKNTYWLNVTDASFPFLAVVAHTNFMDKKHYGGHHLTYIGNYLPTGHPNLSMTKQELLKKFMPFIKRLRTSTFMLHNVFLFTAPFAQPVHERNYSQKIPSIKTSVPNVYLANMDSIVPWDRGTNYAVELGIRAANIVV